MASIGRNDPCPCGSGAKYKKCCLALNSVDSLPVELQKALSWHKADQEYSRDLFKWVATNHRDWFDEATALIIDEAFPDEEALLPFASIYLCWHYLPDGHDDVPAEHYLRTKRVRDLKWYKAQWDGWLSLWEVLEVKAGQWLRAKDLLTGRELRLWERSGSVEAHTRMVLLARVVEIEEGLHVMAGCYPIALPLTQALDVKKEFLSHAFPRRRKLRPDELRSDDAFLDLTADFDLALTELYDRPLPQLQNFHGEALEWTIDHFRFPAARRAEVMDRVATLGEYHDDAVCIQEDSPNGTVTVGLLRVGEDQLQLQTNSSQRGDRLTARLQELGKGLWEYANREHPEGPELLPDGPQEPLPPEVVAHLIQYRQQLMDDWLEKTVPALDGQTPREAAQTAKGRKKLERLLSTFADAEARKPPTERISLDRLYSELGMRP